MGAEASGLQFHGESRTEAVDRPASGGIRFKERVRELTRRNKGVSTERMAEKLTQYLGGWIGYFGKCADPHVRWCGEEGSREASPHPDCLGAGPITGPTLWPTPSRGDGCQSRPPLVRRSRMFSVATKTLNTPAKSMSAPGMGLSASGVRRTALVE